jgi:S1-C subfamily serine protease
MVSNIYPVGAERPLFQTQIPINPGNSGGPIFDRTGRVIGVVTAMLTNTAGINFGIGLDVARKHLARLQSSCECLSITAPAGVPVFVDGAMAGTGPHVEANASPGRTYEVFAIINGVMKKVRATYPEQREVKLE